MNVPYSWLKELVTELPPVAETVELLDGLGLAVEQVFDLPTAPSGVVVVQVESAVVVEGSDHLLHAIVSDGQQSYSVVTGAPNAAVGMLTALAKPGTVMPGAGFTVKAREMMGLKSEGVLCSPRELGLYDYSGDLIAFAEDAPLGAELAELWPGETVIEIELTPNRADAFSLLGVARDLAAKLGVSYRHPARGLNPGDRHLDDGLKVEIAAADACPRFTLKLIEDVTVKPSPIWLQHRLAALGLRPRNNIVDVTNFVTFELGQPSHAYDRDDLHKGTIIVRRAQTGEKLTTLNEEELEFSADDLLITTPDGSSQTIPIGVAGVIGGLHHSVKKNTSTVALEVAHFEPVAIRKMSKRHSLSTDASYRFERGVDPNLPPLASARAAQLIAELGGGRVHPGITEIGVNALLPQIDFRPSRVAFLMALDIPLKEQQRYLESLGCHVVIRTEDDWLVTVPSWRFDLTIEEDLIEEVSRLYGFEHLPESFPAMHFVPEGQDSTHRNLRSLLVGMGLQETISYVFSSDELLKLSAAPKASVYLLNPPSAERSVLRPALFPGMLGAARTNHSAENLALFEIGRVFGAKEQERLSLLLQGNWYMGGWLEDRPVDFYLFKGLLEQLAQTMAAELRLEPQTYDFLHPGVSATVYWNGEEIGWLGRLHPEVAARFELPETYLAELDLPLAAGHISFAEFQRQPHAERDLAIIAPKDVAYSSLHDLVLAAAGERLESLAPFDVYQGKPIPEDKRSVALRLRFRHPERALNDEEVDGYMANVMSALGKAGYDIRDQ